MGKKIMLDPGHAGYYFNASPVVDGFYESYQMWKLAQLLKKELEEWGFTVGLTRQSIYDDPELTARGRMAKGYDLFISLHSNAAANKSPDAPWIIHYSPDGKTWLDEISREIGEAIGPVVSGVMGVSAPYYYTKSVDFDRDGNGHLDDEYYGVLFGAKSVGVPAIIIEHSFHTNERAARWLLSDDNLAELAKKEAAALADFYEIPIPYKVTEDLSMSEKERKEFEELKAEVKKLKEQVGIRWTGTDDNMPEWMKPTIEKLVDKGYLKGSDQNSLEISQQFARTLVILDRVGLFD